MEKIKVIGVGPGGEDYLLPAAQKALEEAEVLVGRTRALALCRRGQKKELKIDADLRRVVAFLKENREKKIAVLVSGDPGLYSLLDFLLKHFTPEELEVIPGLSSVQLAFARAKMTWQDAVIFSLHGREKPARAMAERILPAVRGGTKVALLTDGSFPPPKIAKYLVQHGVRGKKMVVGENLSYPEERVVAAGLEEMAASREEFKNCVVLIADG
ncbi:MAG: precorrin-6y C5,15-methyltransferase (decarboxylating) subunit CbiE [Bacillota bacterium]